MSDAAEAAMPATNRFPANSQPLSLLTHAGNGHPVLRLELLIIRSFFHLCTLRYEVLHFRFEAAVSISIAADKRYSLALQNPANPYECQLF
jgi:hypothetical protein